VARSYAIGAGEKSLFVHSFPLQVAAETGLLGLLAFGLLLLTFLRQKPWQHRPARSILLLFFILGSFTICLNYLLMQMLMATWMALALRQRPWPALIIRPLWAGVVVAAFFAASSTWMRLFQAERLYAAGAIKQAQELNPHIGIKKTGPSH